VVRVATTPSTVDLAAGDVLEIAGRLVAARGDVDVGAVAGGAVVVGGRIRRPRRIAIAAGGDVTLAGTIVPRVAMTVDGGGRVELATTVRAFGADVALRGASEVRVSRPLLLTPLFFVAGSAELASANGLVHVDATVRAPDVRISGAAGVRVRAQVSASPPARSGGSMRIESAAGDVDVSATLRAQAGDGTQPGDGAGGHVVVTAAGAARLASVLVNAFPGRPDAPGGTLAVTAASVSAIGTFDADGDAPGPDFPEAVPAGFRFTATGGDVHLDGAFDARGGPSVLQATAAGTLAAGGVYRVAPAGCIGLSAGGALQTGGATFDTPPVATCP
jgi:hypothetical protein